jgi:hypothetical protein
LQTAEAAKSLIGNELTQRMKGVRCMRNL